MRLLHSISIPSSNFFSYLICVESFPNVGAMKEYVASGAGYLQGGLQRENWERATLSSKLLITS